MTQPEALSILHTGANVFLTGSPGSGKTHTVNAYVAWLRSHGIEPSITASTGIAATHIHGQTIHSWSGIGINDHLSAEALDRIASKEHVVKRIQKTSVLIIDEVSMLSGNVLSMVDTVCREVRHSELPFGGMQVVLVGDFFQLPPISKRGNEAVFAFQSDAWKALNPITCYLSEQHRQDDATFLSVLSAIREGSWDESHVTHIMRRESDGEGIEDEVPRLYTHNEDVDRINTQKLEELKGASNAYTMSETGTPALVEGLKRGCLSPEQLLLKIGALVMFTKNSPLQGYVNGTLGRVVRFERETGYPVVETNDGRSIAVAPVDWAVEEDGRVKAKVTQTPLRLAWAITIHKSQGMSMDQAAIDLSRVFEYGQGYVALSRVRTLAGLHLLGWSESALQVHPDVGAIDAAFQKASDSAVLAFEALEETGERRIMEENFIRASGGSIEKVVRAVPKVKKSTYDETKVLAEEGLDIDQIAKKRSLTVGTICDHIEKLLLAGSLATIDTEDLVPSRLRDALPKIHAVFEKAGSAKLAPAFTKLKGLYSYDDLRIARIAYDT